MRCSRARRSRRASDHPAVRTPRPRVGQRHRPRPAKFATNFMSRTKATIIYRRTGNICWRFSCFPGSHEDREHSTIPRQLKLMTLLRSPRKFTPIVLCSAALTSEFVPDAGCPVSRPDGGDRWDRETAGARAVLVLFCIRDHVRGRKRGTPRWVVALGRRVHCTTPPAPATLKGPAWRTYHRTDRKRL